MAKKWIQKWMPDRKKLVNHKHLRMFGRLLHDPNLWHLNRYSVSTAFSVGLFWAFVPVPFQMVFAAGFAILVRSNLPISIALVWLTNPLTMPPLFYFAYRIGAWVLGQQLQGFHFELSFAWLGAHLKVIGLPFFLGCFICGTTLAILGNVAIRIFWRITVSRTWKERKIRHKRNRELKKKLKIQKKLEKEMKKQHKNEKD